MKTGPIKALVREVLATLPTPYGESVIEDVFCEIEKSANWHAVYDSLCTTFGKTVVNTWSGYWIANALGKLGERLVPSKRSSLITSYSLLDTDAKTVAMNPKEDEALKMMWDFYQAHRSELPADIRVYRESLIELIMSGATAEKAFSAFRSQS